MSEQILSVGVLTKAEHIEDQINDLKDKLIEVDTKSRYADLIEVADNLHILDEGGLRSTLLDLMDALDGFAPRNCYVDKKENEIGIYYLKDKE